MRKRIKTKSVFLAQVSSARLGRPDPRVVYAGRHRGRVFRERDHLAIGSGIQATTRGAELRAVLAAFVLTGQARHFARGPIGVPRPAIGAGSVTIGGTAPRPPKQRKTKRALCGRLRLRRIFGQISLTPRIVRPLRHDRRDFSSARWMYRCTRAAKFSLNALRV